MENPFALTFGLELDRSHYAGAEAADDRLYLGPQGLLEWLEDALELEAPEQSNEYLRIEELRQICLALVRSRREAEEGSGEGEAFFFEQSLELDSFTTAADLLERHDELLLAGWDFEAGEEAPERLKVMALLREKVKAGAPGESGMSLSPGTAERLAGVEAALEKPLFSEVQLLEPLELLPPVWQRLLPKLGPLKEPQPGPFEEDSDLARFQRFLQAGEVRPFRAEGDGSLLLLRVGRASDAAAYVAGLFSVNPDFRPLCLVPDFSSRLDFAMVKEGLPSMGLLSVSLARPGLQLLKLAPAFLWEPIDPYKLMEFVSLPVKPLDEELATVIARLLAEMPGMRGERWNNRIREFFAEAEERWSQQPKRLAEVRRQYNFWFVRTRYELSEKAPKEDILKLFRYLMRWARKAYEEGGEKQQSLLVLHAQARQLTEWLDYLPEEALTPLELERLVRKVYQPSPVQFRPREEGSPDSVHHAAAVATPVEELLWWDFTENEPPAFFSRWYRHEMDWLVARGLTLENPDRLNRRHLWQQRWAIWQVRKRLVLVLPETDHGAACLPHPLLSELSVAFSLSSEGLDKISFRPGQTLPGITKLPSEESPEPQPLPEPQPFLRFSLREWLEEREEETFSSLEDLFYYPHKWFFRYGLQWRKSPILSIVREETLMGKLAHRLFEYLMNEDCLSWSQKELHNWIDRKIPVLLQAEGAVLLMYGREPERVRFVRRMKQAAWFLIRQLQENNWKVLATEMTLEDTFSDIRVKGIADLVLERGDERCVLDLKWRGINYRRALIKNEEDLQLVLYARLLPPRESWAYTAFFILDRVELLARSRHAFKGITPLAPPDTDPTEVNQRIWKKMLLTYDWRRSQLKEGRVELRCEATAEALEDIYREEGVPLMDFLEMKREDAKFDDYGVFF